MALTSTGLAAYFVEAGKHSGLKKTTEFLEQKENGLTVL